MKRFRTFHGDTDNIFIFFRNKSGTQLKKRKKKLQILLNEYDLEIIVERYQKIINYLDVTFELKIWQF